MNDEGTGRDVSSGGRSHFENDRPDTASGSQDDRGALAFDRRVATGLRGPI